MDKREFLQILAGWTASMPLGKALTEFLPTHSSLPLAEAVQDESFWLNIRQGYHLKGDYINLENGYYCMMPKYTLDQFAKHVQTVNYEASYYMRTVQQEDKLTSKKALAGIVGCLPEELIITRNTTESLDTIIGGYPWQAGDEAIMAEQDYGAMLDMFKLQARRYGITNVLVSIPNHPASDEEILEIYRKAITPRTKLMMVSHMINITGHILPIKAICAMAHDHGVEVMVDGAHVIGHVGTNLTDLNCDYYGSSLHKWLSVPLGAGLLYVRKDKISKIWQMFGDQGFADDDIRKLNHTGTHPVHTDLAIQDAVNYYLKLGPQLKEERLRYLQHYWTSQVREVPKVQVNTPVESRRACGIANVGLTHIKPGDLAKKLLADYKIYTVAIDGVGVHGCRITPNIYTLTSELDQLVRAIQELSRT